MDFYDGVILIGIGLILSVFVFALFDNPFVPNRDFAFSSFSSMLKDGSQIVEFSEGCGFDRSSNKVSRFFYKVDCGFE